MKPLLFCCLLLASLACQRKFTLSGKAFTYFEKASSLPDSLLRPFQEGVYALKICTRKSKVDGHLITSYESCPEVKLDNAELDKTIYLLFFEGNRALYFSGRTVWATKRGIRLANDLRNFDIDLASPINRDQQLLRGYYYCMPPGPRTVPGQTGTVYMQLEKYKGQQVYLRFRYMEQPGSAAPGLLLEEAGFSEQDEYDLRDMGPVMKGLDSVFHTKLEFFFCDTIQPRLVSGSRLNQLWPPAAGSTPGTAVQRVTRALEW
ncbi:MAG: hypothetical protein IPM81_06325 [Saprospirales bacterium]|jgi:hypothetical protein|nr:hypothetical protein [Saprospirales bacterium]